MIKFFNNTKVKKIILGVSLYVLTIILIEILKYIFSRFNLDLVTENLIYIFIFNLLGSIFTVKKVYKKFTVTKTIYITILFSIIALILALATFLTTEKQPDTYLDYALFFSRALFIVSFIIYIFKGAVAK